MNNPLCSSLSVAMRCLLALTVLVAGSSLTHAGTTSSWLTSSHPCPGGNRTDALHRDNDGTLWVGCGTNTVGYGLFLSTDGGDNWQAANVGASTVLDEFRVSSISRGHDGALYTGGFNATNGNMVLRFDTGVVPYAVSVTLQRVAVIGRSFHVGTYRELADGRAIAESLNGTDLLYRPNTAIGASAADWTATSSGRQMLDLVIHNDQFYAAGSTIAQPPTVFLPSTTPGAAPNDFVQREPARSGTWTGELWGLAVNDQRLVGVGVDQDNDEGKIFISGADPYVAANYTEISMSSIVGTSGIGTWARGVCMQGDVIAAVGERQPLSTATGRVMLSTDGGTSFSNITPPGVTASVTKCLFEPDGTLVVAGAAGFIGILQADPRIFSSGFEPVM